jgi:hypothetical protein
MSQSSSGSGRWTKRKVDEHKCLKPSFNRDIQVGDEWACDCGTVYVVTKVDRGYDQRENEYYGRFTWQVIQWRGGGRLS